ncbi:MFS transporter [Ktedonobacter racemifer]|uniref:General substrate transporter n=1 Tax=Ktedonobacter racemifer DSM 44963 TaxID=485913 RepID=D6TL00_KTERA|nr:MFS transporter [Ktedonobacter racemifer]EFH86450.1 General substrate transporter [Ktedonobacter racemifer DSM 44963]
MANVATGEVSVRRMLPVITASTLGTAIEWYDFFLYNFFAATIFAPLFFPNLDPVTGILASFTTYYIGFLARPIGGAFFGWFGDRVGRKSTLIVTLILMGVATVLIGAIPTYKSIGFVAPLLITILRFLQGAGVGGEWGGSVLLSLEYGDNRRRGFWASWPQTGVPVGLALAAIALLICKALFPGEAFLQIGWRIPFFLSALLILVGFFIRMRILETPEFTRLKQEQRVAKAPLGEVIRYYWKEIILSALLRSGEQAPFYLFTTFVLSYGVSTLKIPVNTLYTGIILAALIAFVTMPFASYLSDIVGRKRWFMLASLGMAIYAYPFFLLLQTKNSVLVVLALVGAISIFHASLYGPEAAFISEHFSTRLRYSGASLGYQLASLTAGGPAPIIAVLLLAAYKSYIPLVLYIILMALISLLAAWGLREYANRDAAADKDIQVTEAAIASEAP